MTDEANSDVEISETFDASRERLFRAWTDPDQLAEWYGPDGFPVPRDTVTVDPRVGGQLRFTMVSEEDPTFRTGVDARFTEVVENELLACTQEWFGVPGVEGTWTNQLRIELEDVDGKTRMVLREGPHPAGTAEMGRQAWQMMFVKLRRLVEG